MNFSHFFIKRPIFAGVLSILILVVGAIALWKLPISEYPEVVPPSVVVRAAYPGANPKTIAETVAAPLEQAINGVENSLYLYSQAASDGVMTLTVTFKLGTDVDKAQVQVQNRVSQALPKLPEEVRRIGVTTTKQSPDLTMVAHLYSPGGRYDEVYLRNYATLQVKDVLARIPGVGTVEIFGAGEYAMRVWLDPNQVAARGLTAGDVVQAIREQNVQVAAGAVGQQPIGRSVDSELQINTKGRLVTEEEFGEIIVKTGANGEKTLLKDLARVELGSSGYSLRSLLDNQTAVALPIFQAPGANAIQLSDDVRKTLAELRKNFPDGIDFAVVYDPTVFVRKSIRAVITTLIEAILLVVIVVILFLQTWRASIIPLAAVPVSLVGTFAAMHALGFSINALSLFGLVLAIGIVVDDAIVVVENVERNIALGLNPVDATKKAMNEVTGPIIATALVLCAVFIPTAFISGLTGQFYKQFAITIAISTLISAFNSLTLSPALSAILLRRHDAPPDRPTRILNFLLGWIFRPFNRLFHRAGLLYATGVTQTIRKTALALLLYAGLVVLTGWAFNKVPTGFVPIQDKQYIVAFAQLPDASSLDRTEEVIRRMSDLALKQPGVEHAVAFPGLSINGFAVTPNAGAVFITLKPFEERRTPNLSGVAIAGALNEQFGAIKEAFVMCVPPPPVNGLGMLGGFKMFVQDRADVGFDALFQNTQALIGKGYQTPGLAGLFSTFTVNVPQVDAEVDRVKAKAQGVPLQNLFETMQVNLGSLYVNDFNRFGRTFQVIVQADAQFRERAEDITRLKTRNAKGQMVPLAALVTVSEAYGPDRVMRYNGFPAAEINGGPAPGFSSGQAEALMAGLAEANLPKGLSYEWTELTYQRILAGNTAGYIYPLCLLLVFLVLAAQYESLRLPIAIILIVPLCLLFALAGVWLSNGDNNVFTQIGLIVLVGLACKNAILIVEFAKHKQDEGMAPVPAAIEAAQLRLRPILMTSIAFIAGVYPLVTSTGAGAEMRQAMGVAVFAGMIGVTLFGLFLTPVFYTFLMRLGRKAHSQPAPDPAGPSIGKTGLAGGTAAVLTGFLVLSCGLADAGAGVLTVGPDYARPTNNVPAEFIDEPPGNWKEGRPADMIPRGNWWTLFQDEELNRLQERALAGNQDLKAAIARVEQARASSRQSKSAFFPDLSFDPSYARTRYSPNAGLAFPLDQAGNIRVPLDLNYELDLWGRVRRVFEASKRNTEARMAAFETIRLSLHAEVATLYFTLRSTDAELSTVQQTVTLRKEALDIVKSRFAAGGSTELEVARAETELASAESDLAVITRRRHELRTSLAVLLGEPASTLQIPAQVSFQIHVPTVPAGLPSELLERRPDIAEAERDLAARNARIGVAKAAFFPTVKVTGFGGFESADVETLFNWQSRIWSIGPSITLPIFQTGRNRAALRQSQAAWSEGVAQYRQRVLLAFKEVQDALTASRLLKEQADAQHRALEGARRVAELSRKRYDAGFVGYLDVVESERTLLGFERATLQTAGQRLVVSVQLIKALGGGWANQ
jgi:hydrophobe/amphiphile efflux-1 (HAE1) family protein/NodT family efflux transporter outer membrane factor (OMF) lipoprotein